MKEMKEEIVRHLNKYKADEIRGFYELAAGLLLRNSDFHAADNARCDDVIPTVEENSEKKISFGYGDIISEDDLAVFREIESLIGEKKIVKTKRIELLSVILSNDTLLEGLCLACDMPDFMLAQLCTDLGCFQRYLELVRDPVYIKRREYMLLMCDYAAAAANLYGCLHIGEFIDIIKQYEQLGLDYDSYVRNGGSYSRSLFFTPEFLCSHTLCILIENCAVDACVSLSGFLLHPVFEEEIDQEFSVLLDYIQEHGNDIENEKRLQVPFEEAAGELSFLKLYDEAAEKDIYLPETGDDFLRYADKTYHGDSAEEKSFRIYIEENYIPVLGEMEDEYTAFSDSVTDGLIDELYDIFSEENNYPDEDVNENIQDAIQLMDEYGIEFADLEEANVFLQHLMPMINSMRRWTNHGHTPLELIRKKPIRPDQLKIVPESSFAADMLRENRSGLEDLGFNVDPDYGADEIPVISFPDGIKGKPAASGKKIYPNDPCPCGSGKKYKHCCGRNKLS